MKDGTQKIWGGGDAGGIAKKGRAFNVLGTPDLTWDGRFGELIGELKAAGHATVQHRRKNRVSPDVRVEKRFHDPCTFRVQRFFGLGYCYRNVSSVG